MQLKRLTTLKDRQVISSLCLYTVKLPSRRLAVIEEVWTHPDHRRQGHSRRLMIRAIKIAKKLGCECVELTVRQDRPDLQKFYQSLGFFDRLNHAYRLKI